MFDDGKHRDSLAGDGIFGVSWIMNEPEAQYYMYAENANAGKFSPQRAEHEFYTIKTNTLPTPALGDLVINEVLASNQKGATDANGQHEDWIELYNTNTKPIEAGGLLLIDSSANVNEWRIPAGTIIPGKGYLVIWADKDTLQPGLHSNFRLDAQKGSIRLATLNGETLDQVAFSSQRTDVSWGRLPNGTGNFEALSPSFSSENKRLPGVQKASSLLIYPNPTRDLLTVTTNENIYSVELMSTTGAEVLIQNLYKGEPAVELNLAAQSPGIYLLRINNKEYARIAVVR